MQIDWSTDQVPSPFDYQLTADEFDTGRENIKDLHNFCTFYVTTFFQLTPWSRVPLEKLAGFQLVKKFPLFYGTRSFITAFTNARQLSLS